MRPTSVELRKEIELGDPSAELAYEVYIHRLRKYIGAYLAVLGNTDVVTFTAGVGENDAAMRRDALTGLAPLGIVLDEHLNASPARGARIISAEKSPIDSAGDPDQRGAGHRQGLRRPGQPDIASVVIGKCRLGDARPMAAGRDEGSPCAEIPRVDRSLGLFRPRRR